MLNNINKTDLFYDYYAQWITVYKEGAIRKVTMDKYLLTQAWIKQLAPDLKVCELSRITYQKLLNDYAKSHERQTTMDFIINLTLLPYFWRDLCDYPPK